MRTKDDAPPKKLEVVTVGAYEASFVPTVKDFARLDERFRLPTAWDALPAVKEHGFVVFKLRKGKNAPRPPDGLRVPPGRQEEAVLPHRPHPRRQDPQDGAVRPCPLLPARGPEHDGRWNESVRLAGSFSCPEDRRHHRQKWARLSVADAWPQDQSGYLAGLKLEEPRRRQPSTLRSQTRLL